jgi:hypothetical protein
MLQEIKKCRICNSKKLRDLLNLGEQPPANSLHKEGQDVKKFPLKLIICLECKTVQLSLSLSPKFLFNNYFWVTATSSTAKEHAKTFFKLTYPYLEKKSQVIEIASNDGTFLKPFIKKNYKVLGIDPAKNIASYANANGIKTLPNFFSFQLSNEIKKKYKNVGLIFARNVIPHVKNIHSIVKGVSNLSNTSTICAIEFHYSKHIIKELQYDSIYHEHLFYFSIETISGLFAKYNLHPFDVFASPISGGSLVLLFSKDKKEKSKNLKDLQKLEKKEKINSYEIWKNFSSKSQKHANNFKKKIIKDFKANGKLFGYGASARSSTLLNFCKLSNKYIDFIIDKNRLKQNFLTPGTNIPITSIKKNSNKIKKMNMILLAWNFKKEILKEMKKNNYSNKIIIPLKKNDNKKNKY